MRAAKSNMIELRFATKFPQYHLKTFLLIIEKKSKRSLSPALPLYIDKHHENFLLGRNETSIFYITVKFEVMSLLDLITSVILHHYIFIVILMNQ